MAEKRSPGQSLAQKLQIEFDKPVNRVLKRAAASLKRIPVLKGEEKAVPGGGQQESPFVDPDARTSRGSLQN